MANIYDMNVDSILLFDTISTIRDRKEYHLRQSVQLVTHISKYGYIYGLDV